MPATEQLDVPRQNGMDEVSWVLLLLQRVANQVSSPLVRACLQTARTDLAFLASSGEGEYEEGAGQSRLDAGEDQSEDPELG